MVKKYILTGGPGTGKTSIRLYLKQLREYTVAESATETIEKRQAMGDKEPWKNPDFQDWILELQLQKEGLIPTNIERVFIDRGILDGASYYALEGREYSTKLKQAISQMNYEKKVFLIENFGFCEKTGVRREGLEQSLKLEKILEGLYKEKGYEIIRIGPENTPERVEMILKEIKQ